MYVVGRGVYIKEASKNVNKIDTPDGPRDPADVCGTRSAQERLLLLLTGERLNEV